MNMILKIVSNNSMQGIRSQIWRKTQRKYAPLYAWNFKKRYILHVNLY